MVACSTALSATPCPPPEPCQACGECPACPEPDGQSRLSRKFLSRKPGPTRRKTMLRPRPLTALGTRTTPSVLCLTRDLSGVILVPVVEGLGLGVVVRRVGPGFLERNFLDNRLWHFGFRAGRTFRGKPGIPGTVLAAGRGWRTALCYTPPGATPARVPVLLRINILVSLIDSPLKILTNCKM